MSKFRASGHSVFEGLRRFYTFQSDITAEIVCQKLNEAHEASDENEAMREVVELVGDVLSDATRINYEEVNEGRVIPLAVFNELKRRYKELNPPTPEELADEVIKAAIVWNTVPRQGQAEALDKAVRDYLAAKETPKS